MARAVNTHGVHAKPMKASQVSPRSRRPRRAAQLAAAGAVNVRDPATIPISTANRYIVTWPSVQSSHEEQETDPLRVPLCRYTASAAPAPVSSAPARGLGHRELAFERDQLRPVDRRAGDVPERSLARGRGLLDPIRACTVPTIRK